MSLFRKAWELRYAGKVEEAKAEAHSLAPSCSTERAELLLLEASFARHQKLCGDSQRLVEQARQELANAGIPATFQLLMQEGINLDVQSKFAESMRLYQRALELGDNEFEKTLATVNLAIARYNLSMPFAALLEQLGPIESHPLKATLEQLQLVSLKSAFAEGKPEAALALPFTAASQGVYLQAWIESLPYTGNKNSTAAVRFRELALSNASYFQKEFRLQTIEANPRFKETEQLEVPAQERADRLYHWTWRWLADPANFPVALLSEELARFPFDTAHLSLTDEDFLLLRSAGAWLGLFDPSLKAQFRTWQEKYAPKLPAHPLFDLELSCCAAIEAGDLNMLEALTSSFPLPALKEILQKVFAAKNESAHCPDGKVLVRSSDSSIHAKNGKTVSEPVAVLLALLKKDGSLSFPDALRACFGLTRFDPLDHGPRIQNLLSRAKKLLPEGCALHTNSQRIYLDGAENVHVLEGSAHARNFPHFDWPELDRKQSVGLEKKQGVELKAKLVSELSGRREFSRSEMQTRLKLPKATTNRLLLGWTREGFVRAKGAGAARTYTIA